VLKVAQLGLLAIWNDSASPSVSLAVGENEYREFGNIAVTADPVIVGTALVARSGADKTPGSGVGSGVG
jgi:hypothetical protein